MDIINTLAKAVADAKDKEPEELEIHLQNHISTEAIRHLHDHESESWALQFELPNHTLNILGDGTIRLHDTDDTQIRTFA